MPSDRSKVVPNITTQPGQLVVAMPVVGAKAQQGSVASASISFSRVKKSKLINECK
jgi:hypothetical protein